MYYTTSFYSVDIMLKADFFMRAINLCNEIISMIF